MSKNLNNRIIYLLIIFMIISILLINSSMSFTNLENLPLKQLMWYLIGFFIIYIARYIKTDKYFCIGIYLFNLLLLVLVLLFGEVINGSRCWLIIPKIGSFQPSEFMKISLILLGSQILDYFNKKEKNTHNELLLLLLFGLIFIPPVILTFLEPDTGSIIIYLLIAIALLIMSPLRKRWLIILGIIIFVLISTGIYIFLYQKDIFIHIFGENIFYRINRIIDWKNKTGMQYENSIIAIGSAGIFGHGYLKTPIYFPESSTDFIFSHLVSNFGLIGSFIFIVLLIIFDVTLIKTASETSDIKTRYITISTLVIILFGQIQNISMTLGILPIIGIPLPFISYGGSSLISYFLIIGIILKKKKM